MRTVETSQQAGPDKKLHLEIPVDKAGHTYYVVVVINEEAPSESPKNDTWPPGYLDSTIGKWQGDFAREFEGSFEQREPL